MNITLRSSRPGFTLVELLAVVVILGIVSVVAIPYLGQNDDAKVTSATRELVADLVYAQSCAIATGKTHFVVFDAARGKYAVMDSIDPPNVIAHPSRPGPFEVVVGSGPLRGVAARVVDFDGKHALAFDAIGTPYSYEPATHALSPLNAGSIELTNGTTTRTIIVQPMSGQIKVK